MNALCFHTIKFNQAVSEERGGPLCTAALMIDCTAIPWLNAVIDTMSKYKGLPILYNIRCVQITNSMW